MAPNIFFNGTRYLGGACKTTCRMILVDDASADQGALFLISMLAVP